MLAASAHSAAPEDKSLFLSAIRSRLTLRLPRFRRLRGNEGGQEVLPRSTDPGTWKESAATPTAFLKSNPTVFLSYFVTPGPPAARVPGVRCHPQQESSSDTYKLYAREHCPASLERQSRDDLRLQRRGHARLFRRGPRRPLLGFPPRRRANVIGALWEVSDCLHAAVDGCVLPRIISGQGRRHGPARRQARVPAFRDPDSVLRSPFYWAPFQLYAGS